MIKIKCAKNHINKIYESFSQNFHFELQTKYARNRVNKS